MSGQPRRNDDHFYGYPMHRVAAIVNDDSALDAALGDLGRAGVDVTDVDVLSGAGGARVLDRLGTGHGLRGRLLRLAQRAAYEGETLRAQERALSEGRHVIFVPVDSADDQMKIVDILRAAGGYYLLYFRAWSIEEHPA